MLESNCKVNRRETVRVRERDETFYSGKWKEEEREEREREVKNKVHAESNSTLCE